MKIIKSFSRGVQMLHGDGFFQKESPLAAGGKNEEFNDISDGLYYPAYLLWDSTSYPIYFL
jgi:hypothetical protein